MNEKWKEIKKKYWPPKKDQLLILVLFGLLLAVIAIPVDSNKQDEKEDFVFGEEKLAGGGSSDDPSSIARKEDYETRMEQKLEELLGNVEGVGEVRVMLTFEGTGEKQVEKDRTATADESSEETVYEEHGSSDRTPYVTSETNPKVEGVLVIAQGGGNSRIKQEILEAAQALFGIEAHKIKIMKMEGTK